MGLYRGYIGIMEKKMETIGKNASAFGVRVVRGFVRLGSGGQREEGLHQGFRAWDYQRRQTRDSNFLQFKYPRTYST